MRTRPLLLGATLVAAAVGSAAAGVVAHAGQTAKTITVTVREYHISLSAPKAPAGAVKLVVHNAGKVSHQIEIKGPGVTRKTPMLKPGAEATLRVTLRSGTYALWCTVPGHAGLGMKASLAGGSASSSGSSGGSSSSGGGTTTTSSGGGGGAWG